MRVTDGATSCSPAPTSRTALAFSEIFDPRADGPHNVAVTGGTGAYAGAHGTIVAGVNGTNDYLFTLRMP